jgi:integrase/recombinase XerD
MASDLFDNREIWSADPVKAFAGFVQTEEFLKLGRRSPPKVEGELQPMRASSAQVYLHMFTRFARWMAREHITIYEVTPDHLRSFLEFKEQIEGKPARKLTSAIRERYLRVLERVFTHLNVIDNPARIVAYEMFQTNNRGKDKPKAHLTDAQQVAFLRALPQSAPFDENNPHSPSWKRRRDRAMLAMLIGAGLKVSEVIGIKTSSVGEKDASGSIPVTVTPKSVGGVVEFHKTQLRPFATQDVERWLAERRLQLIPGDLLFPANLQGEKLDKATVYRHVKATFERANIFAAHKGGRTLRNSFAARELAETGNVELVGQFLGHKKRKSTEHYRLRKSTNSLLK